jgi:hypothetical protein
VSMRSAAPLVQRSRSSAPRRAACSLACSTTLDRPSLSLTPMVGASRQAGAMPSCGTVSCRGALGAGAVSNGRGVPHCGGRAAHAAEAQRVIKWLFSCAPPPTTRRGAPQRHRGVRHQRQPRAGDVRRRRTPAVPGAHLGAGCMQTREMTQQQPLTAAGTRASAVLGWVYVAIGHRTRTWSQGRRQRVARL